MLHNAHTDVKDGVWRDTYDKIGHLLELPHRSGFCARGKRPARLQRIGNPADQRLVKFSCGGWVCMVCAARKREEAGRHFARMILSTANTHCLWTDRAGSGKEWDAQRRRLDRQSALWVRFGVTSEPGIVIGATTMTMGRALNDTEAAVRTIGEALRTMPMVWPEHATETRVRPINTCRRWKQPKKVRSYERIGWLTLSDPIVLVKRFQEAGVLCTLRRRSVIDGCEVLWDVSWIVTDETRESAERVMSDLSCINDSRSTTKQLNSDITSKAATDITGDGEPLVW